MEIVAVGALLKEILNEVSVRMAAAYADAGVIDSDHPLSQEGLSNGTSIVLDYLEHNETRIALEHLLYMVNEPPLTLSAAAEAALSQLCDKYGMRS
jgi:hypothetical protein